MEELAHRLGNTYKDWNHGDGLILIEAWARDGLSNEQIAENMGVAESTFYAWQNKHPEISEAIKTGKAVVDIEVENALHKRAIGYHYYEVTQEPVYTKEGEPEFDHNGNQLMRTTKRVKKYQAPDTGAAAFWLKNRKPMDWKDRVETNIIVDKKKSETLLEAVAESTENLFDEQDLAQKEDD